ncbi:MAG: GNAT family N-acetyltransferase [archaeon]|jgi:hypothetical protein|nr:GNAT family N-acetyltransferase [archaeon]MDD2477416.1 GNAT family N-acetyltransferase [Candidatus ainarchaeum sp.]MDD3084727.1 GNAT family N-acetyltransferase [Candidatus ainarchaeum sp.]MDD4220947.1 GNAT family N-acetyltransferase [Candidatus ainarchaeum sp.]MDD4662251.1 GNAT family N-acetyltransferase [Candidatus ainarchaeum sp.]
MLKYLYNSDIMLTDLNFIFEIADKEFGFKDDPNQYNPTELEFYNLQKQFPFSFCIIKDKNKIIGFVTLLPCSKKLMNDFLSKKINEAELVKNIDENINLDNFDTLFLTAAYIDPNYRKKGIIKKTYKDMIRFYLNKNSNLVLFGWVFTDQGLLLGKKLSAECNLDFKYIK